MRKLAGYLAAAAVAIAAPIAGAIPAGAVVIDWANWTTPFTADSGSPSGTAGDGSAQAPNIGVTYVGEVLDCCAGPSGGWLPASTFSGGYVGNPPAPTDTMIQLRGGSTTVVDTITFAAPVVNPVMAIWSLGGNDQITASFDFSTPSGQDFVIVSGGPTAAFPSGTTITKSGTTIVLGKEGSGTIEFLGTFSQISWTNPTDEYYYGFTVGIAEGTTPLPGALPLFASGLGTLGLLLARRRKRKAIGA